MPTELQRITFTPHSETHYEMVRVLAKLNNSTISQIASRALCEWLKDNFKKEIELYEQLKNLTDDPEINKKVAPIELQNKWIKTFEMAKVLQMNYNCLLRKTKEPDCGLKRGVHYNQRTSSHSSPYYWNRDMTIEYFQKNEMPNWVFKAKVS